jgi:predicted site-specific integrase-resolvase
MSEERPRITLDEPLLDATQVAELLGVRASTVLEWRRAGLLPCLPLGRRSPRWTRAMLEAHLETIHEARGLTNRRR